MGVRSKQTIVSAVARRSFVGEEGRLRPGQRFQTTEARVAELEKRGLAKLDSRTKMVEPEKSTKDDAPTKSKDDAPTKSKASKKKSTKSKD